MTLVNPVLPAPRHAWQAAPHRPLFLLGALQSVLVMLWWWLSLAGAIPASGATAPGSAHGWLMLYGLFTPFILGFLFTALPNWVSGPPIAPAVYLPTAGLLALGGLLFYPGLFEPRLGFLAVALHGGGHGLGLIALLRTLKARADGQDARQPGLALVALACGLPGSLAFGVGLLDGRPIWWTLSMSLGLWAFLTPLFLAVCHRMLPWFSSRVLPNYVIVRPHGPLWAMVAACLGHAALEIVGAPTWTWLVDLPLAAIAAWFLAHWGVARGVRAERLLAMLHLAYPWAALAFLLYGVDSLAACLGVGWNLGLAPLHALGAGFFAGMLLAMASRVSLGHSGRPLKADRLTWTLFWLVQAAALARVFPDLAGGRGLPWLYDLAAWLWLGAFATWAWRHAPMYWRPRLDGRPG